MIHYSLLYPVLQVWTEFGGGRGRYNLMATVSCHTTIQSVRKGSDTNNKNRGGVEELFQSREVK